MEPYTPHSLPTDDIDWISHISILGKANRSLAKYDGILRGIINQDVLLSPLTTQEAVISSRIEGTQVTVEDIFEYEADLKSRFNARQTNEILEVMNYRKALEKAVDSLRYQPLNINLIQELHRVLLTGVRGKNKDPGKIREIQNFIGPEGSKIEDATFIPPKPEVVRPALSNWEAYLRMDEKDPLVQLSLLKAQFELIHPFRDGNGRIGRMLVPIILYNKKVLSSPLFYISKYFEENKLNYYTRLNAISKDEDWDGWISFFLQAVYEQAEHNCNDATKILNLYTAMKLKLPDILQSKYSIQALDFIFKRPIFSSSQFIDDTRIPRQSALKIIKEDFEKHR